MANRKRKNNDIQNTIEKTKDWTTRTPTKKKTKKNGDRSGVHKMLAVLAPLVARVLLLFNNTKPTWYGNRVGTSVRK